jgi:hypothetical protein
MDSTAIDPAGLTLDELRTLRAQLQHDDDVVSYVRRFVQARLDLVLAEKKSRTEGSELSVEEELPEILGHHLTGGPARPPRPTESAAEHPLALELEDLCARLGANHVADLSLEELTTLADALTEFEHARSEERQKLFERLDALSAELVRRYRDGEASVDGLLAEE